MGNRRKELGTALRVFALLRGEWRDIAVIFVYALGVGLCSLAIPVAVKSLVNSVAFGTLLQPLVVLTSLVAGVLVFSGILQVLQIYAVELLQRRFVVRLALMLAQRIPHVEFHKFRQKFGPEYILRFMEVFSVQKVLASLFLDGIAVFFQVIVGLVLVSFYHPIFLAFAIVLFAFVVIVTIPLGIGGIRSSVRESDAKYNVITWLQDLARTPVLYKSARGDAFAIERADDLVHNYLEWRAIHFRVLLRQIIGSLFVQIAASAILLGIGGWLVMKGELTLGQLVAAELVIGLVLAGVAKVGAYLEKFYDICASVAKLDSILDLPYEELSGSYFEPGQDPAAVRISNLTIQFASATEPTLADLTLTLNPGDKVAIWGENGSGKSSLANCIYRLVDPTSGRVEIDGHNVKDIHPLELRSEVALVQGIQLFHGTIEENITLSSKSASLPTIRDALVQVGLDEEIYGLAEGLKTMLKGEWGPLSKGQALRLMIARAILSRPRLLILDGSLDGIDEKALHDLLPNLTNPKANWTLLVLTHEKGVLPHFERTYRLDGGQLIQIPR